MAAPEKLEAKVAAMGSEVDQLRNSQADAASSRSLLEARDRDVEQLRAVRSELEAALARKEAENEELSKFQMDLLGQLKEISDTSSFQHVELDGSRKAAKAFEESAGNMARQLEIRCGELEEARRELHDLRHRCSQAEMTSESCSDKAMRCDRAEAEVKAVYDELNALRPLKSALDGLERDLQAADMADAHALSVQSATNALFGATSQSIHAVGHGHASSHYELDQVRVCVCAVCGLRAAPRLPNHFQPPFFVPFGARSCNSHSRRTLSVIPARSLT